MGMFPSVIKENYVKGDPPSAIASRDLAAIAHMYNTLRGVDGIVLDRSGEPWTISYQPDEIDNLFTGYVDIAGKWQLDAQYGVAGNEVMDALHGPFKYFKSDPTKPYIKVNFKTLTATEEAGPMPLDGEADCRWYRKVAIFGDLHASV